MPRQKSNLVREYFHYQNERNVSLCLANVKDDPSSNYGIEEDCGIQCRKVLTGSKVSNLKYHLKSRHPRIYRELQRRSGKFDFESSPVQDRDSGIESTCNVGTPVTPHQPREDIVKGLLQLVTVNGRPFSIVEDSGFLLLCGSSLREHNVRYTRRTIGNLVGQAAEAIRNELAEIVKRFLVSVKVDCVKKTGKCFIGLHVQISRIGRIVVFSLPVIKLSSPDNDKQRDMKELILKELARYGILPRHIYSITPDTGANVLRPMKLVDEDCRPSSHENFDPVDEDNDSNSLVDEILNAHWEQDGILVIRCAAHSLQLAVMETLTRESNAEIDSLQNLLKKARAIVRELRTTQQILHLRKWNLLKPILDVKTRWSSTFLMVENLLSLREFCLQSRFEDVELVLTENEWIKLDEFCQCLKPFYLATKKLQDENLTLTDIYKILNICSMETSAIGTVFSQELVLNFIKHRESIMENVLMLSALYLDPRFSFELTDTQREIAIGNILSVHQRLSETEEIHEDVPVADQRVHRERDDSESRYELFLQMKHQVLRNTQPSTQPPFENILEAFKCVPRLSCMNSVLEFWEDNKYTYAPLYKIARIIHAVPGTQLSMIRLFNQLRYVMDDQHSRMTEKIEKNVLLVRSNFQHLKDGFFE